MTVRRWWRGNKVTICSCKLKVEQDLGRERNLLHVLPHLKILTHQAIEKNVGVERKKNKSQNSMIWACTKKIHRGKKNRKPLNA